MTKLIAKLFSNKREMNDIVRYIRTEYREDTEHLRDEDYAHYYNHILHTKKENLMSIGLVLRHTYEGTCEICDKIIHYIKVVGKNMNKFFVSVSYARASSDRTCKTGILRRSESIDDGKDKVVMDHLHLLEQCLRLSLWQTLHMQKLLKLKCLNKDGAGKSLRWFTLKNLFMLMLAILSSGY